MRPTHRHTALRAAATIVAVTLALVGFDACKGPQRLEQYKPVYQEAPAVIYAAPLNDHAMRRAVRTVEDSVYNHAITTAANHMYLTLADPLVAMGYYVPGPLASAQLAATESRTGKELRDGDIGDLQSELGIDAVLFVDILGWSETHCSWSVEAEYILRSTHSGGELMHARVKATKTVPTDHRGRPQPLADDLDFQQAYGCDLETAQRCRLVEILNNYVLSDMPSGNRMRTPQLETLLQSHPEYFNLRIHRDGSVERTKSTDD